MRKYFLLAGVLWLIAVALLFSCTNKQTQKPCQGYGSHWTKIPYGETNDFIQKSYVGCDTLWIDAQGAISPQKYDSILTVWNAIKMHPVTTYTMKRDTIRIHDTIPISAKDKYESIPFKVVRRYEAGYNTVEKQSWNSLRGIDSFFTIKQKASDIPVNTITTYTH